MGKFIHSPTCNQVLSTYDVSHVINFTRFSPFHFSFAPGEPGNEASGLKEAHYSGIIAKSANQIVLLPRYKNVVLYSADPPFLLQCGRGGGGGGGLGMRLMYYITD